jgi:hypothetical protein
MTTPSNPPTTLPPEVDRAPDTLEEGLRALHGGPLDARDQSCKFECGYMDTLRAAAALGREDAIEECARLVWTTMRNGIYGAIRALAAGSRGGR